MENIKKINHVSFIKNRFLLLFFFIILEGAIKKWFIPNSSVYLILIKDLIVLSCISYGFKNYLYKLSSPFEKGVFLWTVLVIVWMLFQLIVNSSSLWIILIGLRNWVLYLWFSLICYRVLNLKDLTFIIKIIILSIIPLAIISVTQHFLPVEHFLNDLPGDGYIFQVIPGIVRTTSTFSFVYGYTQYLMFVCPLIFALIISDLDLNLNKSIYTIIIASFILAVVTSGSRGTIVYSAAMLLPLFFGLRYTQTSIKKKFFIILIVLITFFVITIFFANALEATTQRFELANQSENSYQRLISVIFGSSDTWRNLTIFGKGIGLSSNAAELFLKQGDTEFLLGEFETDRIINEAGLLGIILMLIKFISISFLFKSISILKNQKKALPFIYWSYLTIHILTSTLTGQITSHAFTYLALAIGLVLIKDEANSNSQQNNNI